MLIAIRELTLKELDRSISIPVRLFAPEDKGRSWTCRIEVDWPDGQFELDVHGHDAFQALELALRVIGAVIYSSDYHASGKLTWFEEGRGYGFPVMSAMRDMLVGDDKKFF